MPDAPIVLLDTVTRQRVPYWAELDTWNPDAATKALVIRPARDFVEGHHYVVALRDLKDSTGHVLPAPAVPYADPVDSARLRMLVEQARQIYDWVILDLPTIFSPTSLMAAAECERAFMVSTADLPSLRSGSSVGEGVPPAVGEGVPKPKGGDPASWRFRTTLCRLFVHHQNNANSNGKPGGYLAWTGAPI